jgi:salicylate hydroxylase
MHTFLFLPDRSAQAHASLPHNGAGAGQAIEDAYVLSELLKLPECTVATLPRFLQAYEDVRRSRAAKQQVHSRESGEVRNRAWPCAGESDSKGF